MKVRNLGGFVILASLVGVAAASHVAMEAEAGDSITLPLRTRDTQGQVSIEKVQVKGAELAIVVMDMWDSHWDPNWVTHAGARAEPINQFLHRARARGAVVIHSPTNLISGYGGPVYKNTKQRLAAAQVPKSVAPRDNGFMPKPTELCPWGKTRYANGKAHGMDGKPTSAPNVLSNQCIGIDIEANDYITGEWGTLQEAWNIIQKHKTKYVLYAGGATNMCLIAKPIGLRHIKARGVKTILVRDLAIAWSDPFHWHRRNEKLPEAWHYTPLKADAFVADWVEREMAPAITSDVVSGPSPHTLRLANATATYSQKNAEVAKAIDGSTTRRNGWGLGTHVGVESTAVFELAEGSNNLCGERLDFVLQFASHDKTCLLGKFRLSVTSDNRASFADGKSTDGDVEASWTVLQPASARTLSTATSLQIDKDGSVLCKTEKTPDYDCYYIAASNPLGEKVTGFRIEALPDESLPDGGPGLSSNGNFVLGEINIRTWRPEQKSGVSFQLANKQPTQAGSLRHGFAPETALRKLHVADGLEVELFAAEPLVRQPVTMTVDDRNRVWVIQYLQYPEPAGLKKVTGDRYDRIKYDRVPKPPPHGPRGADRVTILTDTDGDGRADKADDFIDGLNIASGLALGHDGVWVLQSPYLLFYPDRNKDDRPDGEPQVRLVGFGLDDAHSVANSLQWGPDGWLYGVHGSTVNADVRGVKFQQGIWRYHPPTDRFELFSEGGGNTFGLDFDRHGNAIAGTNFGVPGLHQMQGAYHVKNFGKHGALHNPHAFGYFPHMPHAGTSIGKLSVGGVFYQAEQWPTRFRNKYVTANPLNHALYAIDARPRGSTFTTQFKERLLWSDDVWFQPVDLALEADGSLLVADWYDGNINYQRTYRDRNNFDAKRGRIYRISASGTSTQPSKTAAADKLFDHNILEARRALQSLAERKDKSLAPKYAKLLAKAGDERTALHALWALNLCHNLSETDEVAIRCLRHRYAAVRAWSVRLLGDASHVSPAVMKQLLKIAPDETDVSVRAQLACTAKRISGENCLAIAAELARHDSDTADPYLPLLLWWAVESKSASHREQILKWLENPKDWKRPLLRDTIVPRLARRYAAEGGDAGFATCAHLLALAPTSADVERVIGGMEEQLQGLKQGKMPEALRAPLSKLWQGENHPQALVLFSLRMGSDAALREAVAQMTDVRVAENNRIALIDAAGQTGNEVLLNPLLDLFQKSNSDVIRSAALASMARFNAPNIGATIVKTYKYLNHDLRAESRQVLYSRASWSQKFLQAIDRDELKPAEVPYQELPRLMTHTDPALRKLVQKHWGKVRLVTPQEKRDRMLELGKLLLSSHGDAIAGKKQFMNVCGKCHQLHGAGEKLGPDLTPYPRHELSYLLLHSVDPSAVVRPAYQAVSVVTNDGRLLSGILAESKPKTITLLDAKNKRILLARDDIEQIKDSAKSLMPDKVLAELKPDQIRDLFAYLQSKTTEPLRNDLSSLIGRQESFDSPSDDWQITDNGNQTSPVFQKKGGCPGGWIQLNDASGGRMAIVLPKSWNSGLTNYNRGVLSFDARTVDAKNGRPHEAFGLIEITGGGRTIQADAASKKPVVPNDTWTSYRLSLDAKTFRVSESEWKRILSDVSKIIIRIEAYAGANEIMGVDNISLRAP